MIDGWSLQLGTKRESKPAFLSKPLKFFQPQDFCNKTMDGVTVKLEAEEQVMALESSPPSSVEEHLVQHNKGGDDVPTMHLSGNKSMPASGLNAVIPNTNQLTIFYNGSVCIYGGIPAEKVHEIMLIAAAAASKSTEMKMTGTQSSLLSPVSTRPSSPHGATNNVASPPALCFAAKSSSICKLQEFPIARRHSLQRFLEKRRDRLGSKAPYPSSATTKVADNIENNFCGDNVPDLVSFKRQEEELHPTISAS